MAHVKLTLRDEQGAAHDVEIQDGAVAVNGTVIPSLQVRPGEIRAGSRIAWAARQGDTRWVFLDGQVYTFEVARAGGRVRSQTRHEGGLSAPMPATVVRIAVAPGDRVQAGQVVVILEAMKMELPIRATMDGVVVSVRGREGELVQPGHDLVEIAPEEAARS